MSAILQGAPFRNVGADGARRYKTSCKVVINSHILSQQTTLYDDVVAVSMAKTIKGTGTANITLAPRRNFLNFVFPNDYINVYINRGDGEGWIRTFFGFVDRVEESYSIGENGTPSTLYHVICSDFQKAVERTEIYFNPQISGREDLQGSAFSTPNVGGLALQSMGIRVSGSPADMILNVLYLLLGFGTQFALPQNYNPKLKDRLRAQRADFLLSRIGEDLKKQVADVSGFFSLIENLRTKASTIAQGVAGQPKRSALSAVVKETGVDIGQLESSDPSDVKKFSELLGDSLVLKEIYGAGKDGVSYSQARSLRQELESSLEFAKKDHPPSLLDIIDTTTFVERRAIDGYFVGASVWQKQGSLFSLLQSFSNESVNELFFDLRPINVANTDELSNTDQFSRDNDDVGGNVGDNTTPPGVLYVPSLVFREYPFSTIDGVDATQVDLTVTNNGQKESLGMVYFGDIFATDPNKPGRHVISIPNINVDDRIQGKSSKKGQKHLDVAVISEKEIISSTIGRSDHEHYNLFEMYSDALLGSDARFYMHDILPIISPIHIMRHGLRVRSVTTRFARFGPETVNKAKLPQQPVGEDPVVEETPSIGYSLPITGGSVVSKHGYRHRAGLQNPDGTTGGWVYHNGVDISAAIGVPVLAVADGEIVASTPNGTNGFGFYGQCLILKHKNENVFSLYAHLSERLVGADQSSRKKVDAVATSLQANGKFVPIPVKAGQVIGKVGITAGRNFPLGDLSHPNRDLTFFRDQSHLHFEIITKYPAQNKSATPDIPDPTKSQRPVANNPFSQDPQEWFASKGLNLPTGGIRVQIDNQDYGAGDEADKPVEEEDVNQGRPTDQESQPVPEFSFGNSLTANVDTPMSRRQLLRWALLNDHWHSKNIEYLNGTIEMRGAPEIRVGMRLDILERNMSFYVESVNHTWNFPDRMSTVLTVTRGQPNNPYPGYVLPAFKGFGATETQRKVGSRLGTFFLAPDPVAVRRSLVFRRKGNTDLSSNAQTNQPSDRNVVDDPSSATAYNEAIIFAGSSTVTDPETLMEQQKEFEKMNSVLDKINNTSTVVGTAPQGAVPEGLAKNIK